MTITLDLPQEVEDVYVAAAVQRGIPVQALLAECLVSHRPQVSMPESARLTGAALVDAMQSSPHKDFPLDIPRVPMPVREVDF